MANKHHCCRRPGNGLPPLPRKSTVQSRMSCSKKCPARLLFALIAFLAVRPVAIYSGPGGAASAEILTPEKRAFHIYVTSQKRSAAEPRNAEALWEFARAAFDWAEFARNDRQRAEIAEEGISAARRAIGLAPNSAGAHYFLGMNLGQLARTKSLGALKLVDEMEREFKKARELDQQFDHAGPDRNLGLLYLEAPVFSVGDKKKARIHLLRAVELRPNYPENRLNLIEALSRWGEKAAAYREFVALEKIWSDARKELSGEQWNSSWADWERRVGRIREQFRNFAPK